MENEKQEMKNEKWKTKNEKRKTKNEKWKTKNEKWKMNKVKTHPIQFSKVPITTQPKYCQSIKLERGPAPASLIIFSCRTILYMVVSVCLSQILDKKTLNRKCSYPQGSHPQSLWRSPNIPRTVTHHHQDIHSPTLLRTVTHHPQTELIKVFTDWKFQNTD